MKQGMRYLAFVLLVACGGKDAPCAWTGDAAPDWYCADPVSGPCCQVHTLDGQGLVTEYVEAEPCTDDPYACGGHACDEPKSAYGQAASCSLGQECEWHGRAGTVVQCW